MKSLRRTPLQRAMLAARIALLAISLCAGTAYGLLRLRPDFVDWIGDGWTGLYERIHRGDLEAALELAARDPEAGAAALDRFVAGHADLSQGDRLTRMLVRAYDRLADIHDARGDLERKLAALDRWLELSPNDLQARCRRGRTLCQMPDRRAEGLLALRDLNTRLPEVDFIADAYAEQLLAEGGDDAIDRAFAALAAVTEHHDGTWWRVHRTAQRWYTKLRALPRGDRHELQLRVHRGAVGLEFETPRMAPMQLDDVQLRISDGRATVQVPFLAIPTADLLEIDRLGDRLRTRRDRAGRLRVLFAHVPRDRDLDVTLGFRLTPLPSDGMMAMAVRDDVLQRAQQRAAAGDGAMLRALGFARARRLERGFFEVFWHGDGEDYSGGRSVRLPLYGDADGDQLAFNLRAPLAADVAAVRVDLPGIGEGEPPRQFRLAAIAVDVAGEPVAIDFAPAAVEFSNQLERDGDLFTATGHDPYFSIRLPQPLVGVQAVYLRGTTR